MQSQKVTNARKFIDSYLAAARANIGKNMFSAFFDQLVRMKELLLVNK